MEQKLADLFFAEQSIEPYQRRLGRAALGAWRARVSNIYEAKDA